MLLNVSMKFAFERSRPRSFDAPLLALSIYSFPSGHAAGATLFYGVLAAVVIANIRAWRWRVLIALAALLIVMLVGLSRIYLGDHYLSDVLAAFTESVAWLTLCLMAVHTLRERRAISRNGP
jgi:undecaprenyl-diphosphatase